MNTLFLEELGARKFPLGGFSERPGGDFRPDATAWAGIVFAIYEQEKEEADRLYTLLSKYQAEDGRIPLSPDFPQAWWPTPLAVLTWQAANRCCEARDRAVDFLLSASGKHWTRQDDPVSTHDPSLKGWSWIENTHSWIEPTSLSIMALHAVGEENHPRTVEGTRMLMDRQLPSGGWNYGNTRVFDRDLHPLPDTSGMALQAVAGQVPADAVKTSLDYLESEVGRISAPFSLGWAVLGLSAWGRRPPKADEMITGCLHRKIQSGSVSTSSLCILLVAMRAREGVRKLIAADAKLSRG